MVLEEIKGELLEKLPNWIEEDPYFRYSLVKMLSSEFASKNKSESRFDILLQELQELKRDSQIKWEENSRVLKEMNEESNRKWEENNKKWEENNKRWEENSKELKELRKDIQKNIEDLIKRQDRTVGALGARWGISSEKSFRLALASILEESFGVKVININDFDDLGEVFGRPDQIELDIIIKNGTLIILELKSSISKADIYIFDRKVSFYEKKHQRVANRKIVISPMVPDKVKEIADKLNIEVFFDSQDVESI